MSAQLNIIQNVALVGHTFALLGCMCRTKQYIVAFCPCSGYHEFMIYASAHQQGHLIVNFQVMFGSVEQLVTWFI